MSNRLAAVLATTLVVLLLASLFVACGAPQEATPVPAQEEPAPSTLDGKTLVQERCTKCHGLGQVERAKKTEEEWKATVERMVAKGAQLSQAEQELVIQYLAETYPK